MYTLRFVNNCLQLSITDSDHDDVMILKQPFRPGDANSERRNWDSAGEALTYWNETLVNKYPKTIDNITIEVS
jgi:hypothetical protein